MAIIDQFYQFHWACHSCNSTSMKTIFTNGRLFSPSTDNVKSHLVVPASSMAMCTSSLWSVLGQAELDGLYMSRGHSENHQILCSESPDHRGESGRPSGLLSENAVVDIIWPFLATITTQEAKLKALDRAFTAYTQAGYTGLVDMAMDETTWEVLQLYRQHNNPLTHRSIPARPLFREPRNQPPPRRPRNPAAGRVNCTTSAGFCIIGIKPICDGVVDGCTGNVRRLGELGITASVQPVHTDPVFFRAWPSLIGERRQRAFAYREFVDGEARIAVRTDAPTVAHLPLLNMYNATTRHSALEPGESRATNAHFD